MFKKHMVRILSELSYFWMSMKIRNVGTWYMYFFTGTERHWKYDQNKIQPLKFLFLQAAQRRREIIEQALTV